jgi:hypothetical protein
MNKFILVPETIYFSGSCIRSGGAVAEFTRPGVYTTQDAGHISVEQTRFNSELIYDPLTTYVSWYANSNSPLYTSQVHSWLIHNCFWHQREISQWIEDNCEDLCFARRTGGEDWSMSFLNSTDWQMFQDWIQKRGQRPFPFVKVSENDDPRKFEEEINRWCTDNFAGKFRTRVHNSNPCLVHMMCQDPDDLVLFKLRWGDMLTK